MNTKAIHLEMVTNLTAETFLNSLKRFIARGKPLTIFSVNATNFKGAKIVLIDFFKVNTN